MTKKDIEIQAIIQLRLEIERGLHKSLIIERIDSISELGDKKSILKQKLKQNQTKRKTLDEQIKNSILLSLCSSVH